MVACTYFAFKLQAFDCLIFSLLHPNELKKKKKKTFSAKRWVNLRCSQQPKCKYKSTTRKVFVFLSTWEIFQCTHKVSLHIKKT
uniref:Secreted protein n=1 Tax=Pyxicephalus adspersus TaxID=30357 RepID=A0AAV3AFY3_PYXAD|nr:TPA: hypothetical protein GDO54_006264 [Pyxicephalus adspersus]